MIPWNEIDARLTGLGKDRAWLASATPYSPDTIRTALAPGSTKRSERMLSVLSRAIEDEEANQNTPLPREVRPGVFEIFQTAEQLDAADRASRAVGAPSLAEFCRDVIIAASERLLSEEEGQTGFSYPSHPLESLKVAEKAQPGDDTANESRIAPFPNAGSASDGSSSPGKSNGGNA